MAKNNINNALNDWFSEPPKNTNKDSPAGKDQVSTAVKASIKPDLNKKTGQSTKEISKPEKKQASLLANQQVSKPETSDNTTRVKFGSYIREDLLKKLKVKSVEQDKSIYELIEIAVENYLSASN